MHFYQRGPAYGFVLKQCPFREKYPPSITSTIMTVIVKNKIPLVVPPAIRREAGLKGGQEVEFRVKGGVISIHRKPMAKDEEYTPRERRIIDASIAKGLADFKAGRTYGPFSTHKEFIASLHREIKKLRLKKTKLLAR